MTRVTAALALVLGIVAGLRSMTPPAVVAWAAHWGKTQPHRPQIEAAVPPLQTVERKPAS